MVIIGYLLFVVSFLAGALVAVQDKTQVNWWYFGGCVAVGALGVVLIRLAHRDRHHSDEALAGNFQSVREAIEKIVANMKTLGAEVLTLSPYEVHERIDDLFARDIETFVEARKSIARKYSLQVYSEVMNHFAAAERYLNRVWSASVDGYIDEVRDYTQKASDQFEETRRIIEGL